MNISFLIAKRYFFSKSKQKAVNVINLISLSLIVISSATLIIVLSGFSGLKDYGLSFSNSFDPEYRIIPKTGKTFLIDSTIIKSLKRIEEIKNFAPVIEEKIFLSFRGKNHVAYLRGIDSTYLEVIPLKKLIKMGELFNPKYDEVVIGSQIANILNLGIYDYNDFLSLTALKKESSRLISINPFIKKRSLVSGVFQVGDEVDKKYLFSSLNFSRNLFQIPKNYFSYIDVSINKPVSSTFLEKKIQSFFSDKITIKNKQQLNPAFYKMLNTENIAIYFIFTLVLVISLFNVIGSLNIMILEKKPNLKILNAIGFPEKNNKKIFFYLGLMISWVGGFLGLIIGFSLLLIQYYSPFLYVPGTSFPYPVSFKLNDIFLVLLTLFILGLISSLWSTLKYKN